MRSKRDSPPPGTFLESETESEREVDSSEETLFGKPMKHGYQAHYVTVNGNIASQYTTKVGIPCLPQETERFYDELAVFQARHWIAMSIMKY